MTSETQPDRAMLEGKARDELMQIAEAMGVKVGSRARKAQIVAAILGDAGASDDAASGGADNGGSAPDAGSEETDADAAGGGDGPRVRRRRSPAAEAARPSDGDAAEAASESGDAAASETDQDTATGGDSEGATDGDDADTGGKGGGGNGDDARGGGRNSGKGGHNNGNNGGGSNGGGEVEAGNRRRRRRGRDRDRDQQEFQGDPVPCHGILDLRDEGYGFLRTSGPLPSSDDVYVAAKQVRQLGLRKGDVLTGASRPATRNEKNPAMLRIDEVNGGPVDGLRDRPQFDALTPLFPDERLRLEMEGSPYRLLPRIIDLVAPIGKGQRGLIVSPPKAGKTTVMKQIAQSIEANDPDVALLVLLLDERPEEVTDMSRSVNGEVVASTFDRPPEEHIQVAELTIERAKRMVEAGRDVVLIVDGITRLARAYNLAAPGTGRMMSGGVDAAALYPPKRFLGAARNVEEGGSLTILATALVETGSRMDEVIFEEFKGTGNMELRLDRDLAERRIFPAIDVLASSTRHEELLIERRQLDQVQKLRRVLAGLADTDKAGAAVELLLERLEKFGSNTEFLAEIAKAPRS